MKRFVLLIVALALGQSGATAIAEDSPSAKKAWQYTDEERIALRTDPELARDRVREVARREAARVHATGTKSSPHSVFVDDFDGSTHPELFMPHEVFRTLMALAFPESQQSGEKNRKALMADAEHLHLPADFWERLRSISATYMADSSAAMDLGRRIQVSGGYERRRAEDALDLKNRDICRSRADAIAAARKEFGRERFDRFLYEVIAVHKFHSADLPPDANVLRWVEGGCR